MIGLLVAAAALALIVVDDGPKKPKTRKVVYVYERLVTEDQPIPFMVTDSVVVREENVP